MRWFFFFGSSVIVGTAMACGSSSEDPASSQDQPIEDAGARSDAQTERVDGSNGARVDAGEADAGGRDAEFTHVALCTANWLEHDLGKPYRFAVEYAEKPDLPNGSQQAMLWWTPLRSSATVLRAEDTVGGTFGVEEETVLDSMDAQLADVTLPSSANPENETLLLKTVGMNVMPPERAGFCGTLSAEDTVPQKMEVAEGRIGPYLRCVFRPTVKGQPLPTVTADDYSSASCASAGSWPYVW